MGHVQRRVLAMGNSGSLTRRGFGAGCGRGRCGGMRCRALSGPPRREISPVMAKLSTYMSEAGSRALPDQVVQETKYHILDTLAAMVSGSEGCRPDVKRCDSLAPTAVSGLRRLLPQISPLGRSKQPW